MPPSKKTKINLNQATEKEFTQLSGIGSSLAAEIIKYRKENGSFKSISDLKNVKGISDRLMDSLKDKLQVGSYTKEKPSQSKDTPVIHFFGETASLEGHIQVQNQEDAPKRRFNLNFSGSNLLTKRNKKLEKVKIRSRLGAGQSAVVPVRISIAGDTPPGIHEVEATMEGQSYKVIFDIAENIDVQFSQTQIYLQGAPGAKLKRSLYLKNRGNVPVLLKSPGAIALDDPNIECRAIRGTVRKLIEKNKKDLEGMINALSDALVGLYEESGALRVRLDGDEVTIPPSQVVKVNLTFTLPSGIRMPHQYYGLFSFYNSSLRFIVIPTATKAEVN